MCFSWDVENDIHQKNTGPELAHLPYDIQDVQLESKMGVVLLEMLKCIYRQLTFC